MRESALLGVPTFPAASMTTAVKLFAPSLPSVVSLAGTGNVWLPATICALVSRNVSRVVLPTFTTRVSPMAAPEVPRPTGIVKPAV